MQNTKSEQTVTAMIENILSNFEAAVDQKKLISNIPCFMLAEAGKIIGQNMMAVMPEADVKGLGLTQDLLGKVPKLEKDTLMPKDLSEEKIRLDSPVSPRCLSPRSSCSSMKKSMRMSKRSSIKLTDKLKSITVYDRQMSERKGKKDPNARFSKLNLDNSEDQGQNEPEIDTLREKTELRMKYLTEIQKLKSDKQKFLEQRRKQYNETIDGKSSNDMTFDYEGDCMRATLYQDRIRVNTMRTGMGIGSQKLKEGFSKINAETFYVSNKKAKDMGDNSFIPPRQHEMPLFPMKKSEPYNIKNLKLDQYRKTFGQKYSRIAMNQTQYVQKAPASRDDLFGQKKHLTQRKDTVETVIHQNQERISRRLALPKLHGTYKVLDRYE